MAGLFLCCVVLTGLILPGIIRVTVEKRLSKLLDRAVAIRKAHLNPFRSYGRFSLESLSLTNYAPLYQDFVRFEVKDGTTDLHATFRYEKSDAQYVITVTNTDLSLMSLNLADKETGQSVVAVAKTTITGASGDVLEHTAAAGSVNVTDGRFVLSRNRDASINAIELLDGIALGRYERPLFAGCDSGQREHSQTVRSQPGKRFGVRQSE
jgi:hypothetical protein